jgi:hypothetical protein
VPETQLYIEDQFLARAEEFSILLIWYEIIKYNYNVFKRIKVYSWPSLGLRI